MPCQVPRVIRPLLTGMEIHGGQSGADVSRHVVLAFGGVNEHGVAIGYEAGEESFEVATDIRVGIFLNQSDAEV